MFWRCGLDQGQSIEWKSSNLVTISQKSNIVDFETYQKYLSISTHLLEADVSLFLDKWIIILHHFTMDKNTLDEYIQPWLFKMNKKYKLFPLAHSLLSDI